MDMDLLAEMERMCANTLVDDDEITQDDVERWQRLFNLAYEDARNNIKKHKSDVCRQRISDELWQDMRAVKEAEGYDREAYEYELFRLPHAKQLEKPATARSADNSLRGMILAGPIDTLEKVQEIAGLSSIPAMVPAESENQSTSLCYVTREEKQKIRNCLLQRGCDFRPFFVNINIAAKRLSSISAAPTLGVDATLPQRRANSSTTVFAPSQHQYPVYYFFYGTLADPGILTRMLSLSEPPTLTSAHITGGGIKNLGSHKALVDTTCSASRVDGHAYMVASQEHERELRVYETNMYEVVRCDIWMAGSYASIKGLTFRSLM